MSGHRLDITDTSPGSGSPRTPSSPVSDRLVAANPYLRVYFACSNQYVRVRRSPNVNQYLARCPSCGKTKSFLVGSHGTDQRFFRLTCR
jgi:hypothetical protein